MPSFDVNALGLLIALAVATMALVIKNGVLSVVRVANVVRVVVPIAPSRARKK